MAVFSFPFFLPFLCALVVMRLLCFILYFFHPSFPSFILFYIYIYISSYVCGLLYHINLFLWKWWVYSILRSLILIDSRWTDPFHINTTGRRSNTCITQHCDSKHLQSHQADLYHDVLQGTLCHGLAWLLPDRNAMPRKLNITLINHCHYFDHSFWILIMSLLHEID